MILDVLIDTSPAGTAVRAIHAGDLITLRGLLDDDPGLARGPLAELGGRTLLHAATDWPGHFPNVAVTIALIIAAGADPNVPGPGPHPETALHWAASSNDTAAIDALLDGGADIDAPGAVIAGGTPMADAPLSVSRQPPVDCSSAAPAPTCGKPPPSGSSRACGSSSTRTRPPPRPPERTSPHAFWGACHGGQADTAATLLSAGADLNWTGWDDLTPLDAARRSQAPEHLFSWLQEHGATCATARATDQGVRPERG